MSSKCKCMRARFCVLATSYPMSFLPTCGTQESKMLDHYHILWSLKCLTKRSSNGFTISNVVLLTWQMARDLKEAAEISMGTEITPMDIVSIKALADQVCSFHWQPSHETLRVGFLNACCLVIQSITHATVARNFAHEHALTFAQAR